MDKMRSLLQGRHVLHVAVWLAAVSAAGAQTRPGAIPSNPAPDLVPPPVTQPDAVRHAAGPEESRMRSDPFMDFNDPRVRSEMSECTALPREARGECVRGLGGGRSDGITSPGRASPSAPGREPGMPLRDRDPGVNLPR